MRDSTDLLSDPTALRARFDEDGYLLARGLLDPDRVAAVRRDMVTVLEREGWLMADHVRMSAHTDMVPVREGDDAYFEAYDGIQRLESFHRLGHEPALVELLRTLLGPTAFPHPLKVARLVFPNNHEVSTPPHQDFPNNQGTPSLTAAWVPLGDCPMALGSLAVLQGSHRLGVLPLKFSLGPGNRQVELPEAALRELRWVSTDFAAGDVLVFGSLTVHASLHNAHPKRMRLSADFRYQPEDEPLTDLVLRPHFGRLTWEEIYEGWESQEDTWYWKDLDLEVVPFDGERHEVGEPTVDDYADALRYKDRLEVLAGTTDGDDG